MGWDAKFVGENFENSCGNSIRAAAKFGRKFAHEFADTFGIGIFFTARGATSTVVNRLESLHGFCPSYDTRDIFIPSPARRPGLSRSLTNRQNTYLFTILQSELALPITGSWLLSRLSST